MRCLVLCSTLILLLAAPIRAADEVKPNTLTPAEIADGWILLFDGETDFGWRIEGDAKVADGALRISGQKETRIRTTTYFHLFDLQFQYRFEGKDKIEIVLDKYQRNIRNDEQNAFFRQNQAKWGRGELTVGTSMTGGSVVASFSVGNPLTPTYHAVGPAYDLMPIEFKLAAGSQLALRSIKLRPKNTKSIFNGKDLAGWKEFPGRKSKFTVTPEGWLNIKNGPGDLQTEGQYADFVLHLECISNGKHLNSGVFFRCRPNEYQQGYEAQIHNGFMAEAGKEYTIEEYDPKTNELKDKKKIKATALDYGTGAIYRRVPARKQMAKDNEWFTMTVVARGRHLATWVNGVQMVDWTDNRPLKDNARNGCRLEVGPISLQGHDPTTDLSFRNFRIGEFGPSGKK